MAEPAPKAPGPIAKAKAWYAAHPVIAGALFFLGGFLFDVFTLGRIDDRTTLLQQGAYLSALGLLLAVEQRYEGTEGPRLLRKVWHFREEAIHFFFGSLLSAYSLFFFKSASGFVATGFLAAVFGLLVANELPAFRRLGPVVRYALYGLCLTSYFAYLLPVLSGHLASWLFLLACGMALGPSYILFRRERVKHGWGKAVRRAGLPPLSIQLALAGLYFLRAIPPVPLSVNYLGVFHEVKRDGKDYALYRERGGWELWGHGDQTFRAQPQDKIYAFARVFAPTRFEQAVTFRWYFKNAKGDWEPRGSYSHLLEGGRDRGFRVFASKSNYQPGSWRVAVESADGREIGRMSFEVVPDEPGRARDLQVIHE